MEQPLDTADHATQQLAQLLHCTKLMKRIPSTSTYRVEELVAAAYRAASQATRNHMLAAMLASKILEGWLTNSDRPDLVSQLETASP